MRWLVLLSASICLMSPYAARAQQWERIGPDSALPCTIAASSAASSVYAGFFRGGVFRSDDRGTSWEFAGAGIGPVSSCVLAVDPADSERLFVLTSSGALRSVDGGRSWSTSTAGLPVPAAPVDLPSHASLVFAGPRRRDVIAAYPGGVFASRDGGATWVRRDRGLRSDVRRLAADPRDAEVIYGVTSAGFVKSVNEGGSWLAPRPGLHFAASDAILGPDVVVSARSILAANIADGVFRSRDGGSHWARLDRGLGAVGVRPHRLWIDEASQRIFLSAEIEAPQSHWQTFLSDDDGSSWSPAAPELQNVVEIAASGRVVYAATPAALLRSTDHGSHWSTAAAGIGAGGFTSIVADPAAHATLYASGDGFWRTLDRGQSWQRETVDLAGEAPSSLVFLPTSPPTLVGGVSGGIALSQDGGEHWTFRRGLECLAIEQVWVVPEDPPLLYATGPAPDTGCVLQDPHFCAAGKSADQGVTWSCATLPRDSSLIAVDPLSAALYARHFPAGLSRSLDGGDTFAPVTGARRADLLVFDPRHAGVGYAGTDLGVARSADGGASWTRLAFPVTEPVVALALGPEDPATVYAATLTNLYRSRDGGGTWTAVGSGLGEALLNAILIDPDDPSTLYLATTGGSVMRLRQAG